MPTSVPALLFVALATATSLTPEALAAAPRYRMVLDGSQPEQGVQTVSLVKNPAIRRNWVTLSAVEASPTKRFHLSEAEGATKQVLTGPALVPGQEILRLDAKGEPFYITFDAATIEATARQFAAQGHHNSTNQDHATALAGNVVFESWLVADPEKDKAAALGLSVEPGTWMLSVHIPDADYWQNEIVTGNKLGFSIEGLFTTEQLTLSAVQPAAPSLMATIFQKLGAVWAKLTSEQKVALGLEKLADGRTVSIDDTTGAVLLVGEDGQPGEALTDGEYELEGGGKLVVKEGKKAAAEVEAAKEPTATEGEPTEKPAAEAAPAPLPEGAGLPEIVTAINELIKAVGGKEQPKPDATTEPAAPKLAAQLHGVKLEALGEKLTTLKLDAIELAEGEALTYNAVSRRLSDANGALVESGYYAAADGSYFQVSTDQYIWQIDKQTYDAIYGAKLAAVELAALKTTTPAAGRLRLNAEKVDATAPEGGSKTQKLGLSMVAHLRALQAPAEAK